MSACPAGAAIVLGAAALAAAGLAMPADAGTVLAAAVSPAGAGTASPSPGGDPGDGLIIFRWGDLHLVQVPGSSGNALPGE